MVQIEIYGGNKMGYDYKKTLQKFGASAVIIILAGLASTYGDSHWYLALVPVFEAIKNAVKHWND